MGDKVKKALKIAAIVFIGATLFSGTGFVKSAKFFKLTKATALAAKAFAYTLALGVLSKGISATGGNFGSKLSTRAPTEPRQIIYGKTRVGGTITHISTTGTDNHLLHMVFVIAGHEVNSLEAVILNDETLTTSSSTISGSTVFTATNSKFTNTENPISVPVGEATLGRIMNVLGEPIDENDRLAEMIRMSSFDWGAFEEREE